MYFYFQFVPANGHYANMLLGEMCMFACKISESVKNKIAKKIMDTQIRPSTPKRKNIVFPIKKYWEAFDFDLRHSSQITYSP